MYKNKISCSFCRKDQKKVKKIIADPTVYICDECITLCEQIINEGLNEETKIKSKHHKLVTTLQYLLKKYGDINKELSINDSLLVFIKLELVSIKDSLLDKENLILFSKKTLAIKTKVYKLLKQQMEQLEEEIQETEKKFKVEKPKKEELICGLEEFLGSISKCNTLLQ